MNAHFFELDGEGKTTPINKVSKATKVFAVSQVVRGSASLTIHKTIMASMIAI